MIREALALSIFALAGAGCSVAIGSFDECSTDADCGDGKELSCVDKLCVRVERKECTVNADCRALYGFGSVCSEGICSFAPPNAVCRQTEPTSISEALGGQMPDGYLIGAIFKLGSKKEEARSKAATLAVREMNQAGGILGKTVGLVICDNDVNSTPLDDAEETRSLALYLGDTLGTPALIGPSSSANATAAVNALIGAGTRTLVISPSATSSALTNLVDRVDPADPYGLFWRTCPSDALQGQVLATVVSLAELTRIAVLYQHDVYGQGLEEQFRTAFLDASVGNDVFSRSFELDGSDIGPAVLAVSAQAQFDSVLVISGDASRTRTILEAAAAQPTLASLRLFLSDGSKDASVLLDPTLPPAVRAFVASVIGTAPARPTGTAFQTFANNLDGQFGVDASAFSFLAHSYDAAYIAAYGTAWASRDGAAVDAMSLADGLAHLSSGEALAIGPTSFTLALNRLRAGTSIDVDGTSGPLELDASAGEAPGPIEVWRVNAAGTAFETIAVVTP